MAWYLSQQFIYRNFRAWMARNILMILIDCIIRSRSRKSSSHFYSDSHSICFFFFPICNIKDQKDGDRHSLTATQMYPRVFTILRSAVFTRIYILLRKLCCNDKMPMSRQVMKLLLGALQWSFIGVKRPMELGRLRLLSSSILDDITCKPALPVIWESNDLYTDLFIWNYFNSIQSAQTKYLWLLK